MIPLPWLVVALPISNVIESVVDGCRSGVQPVPGSVVYCDYFIGCAEHSGIYLGGGKIAHLNRHGRIECVDKKAFSAGTTALSVLVSSRDCQAVGSRIVAERARKMLGQSRKYNLLLDNCHQFTAGCLTGDFENCDNFLRFLKITTKEKLGSTTWREWR